MCINGVISVICAVLLITAMCIILFSNSKLVRKSALSLNVIACLCLAIQGFKNGENVFGVIYSLLVIGNFLSIYCFNRT